jgi:hypothetical protein
MMTNSTHCATETPFSRRTVSKKLVRLKLSTEILVTPS